MLSKTRTNSMYLNSAARARGARDQSPKRKEILQSNYSFFILFCKAGQNSKKQILAI